MQYFIPKLPFADVEAITKAGIGYAFDSHFIQAAGTGPDGSHGTFIGRGEHVAAKEHFEWEKLPDSEVWFGWRRRFAAEDYARPQQIDGELVQMANGQMWLVPTAYDWARPDRANGVVPYGALPRLFKRAAGGRWAPGDVLPVYQDYWTTAVEVASRYFHEPSVNGNGQPQAEISLTHGELFDLAVVALRVNYYVSYAECGALGLIANTPDMLRSLIHAVCGMSKFEQLLKKTG